MFFSSEHLLQTTVSKPSISPVVLPIYKTGCLSILVDLIIEYAIVYVCIQIMIAGLYENISAEKEASTKLSFLRIVGSMKSACTNSASKVNLRSELSCRRPVSFTWCRELFPVVCTIKTQYQQPHISIFCSFSSSFPFNHLGSPNAG